MRMPLVAGAISTLGLALAAASASPAGGDEQILVGLEQRWAKAVVDNDTATLDGIVAPDWSNQGPYGLRTGRPAMFASMAARREHTTSMTVHGLKVRVLGDIAVVQGVEDEVSTHAGRDTSGRYTFMDVFQRRGGKWMAIASQPTFIGRTSSTRRTGGPRRPRG